MSGEAVGSEGECAATLGTMTGTQRVGVIAPPVRPFEAPSSRWPQRSIDRLRRLDLPPKRDPVAVVLFMGLACLLRIPNLGRAFWIDEGISVGISSQPLDRIPGLLRLDGSPPLWYFLLHFWIRLFGTSADATHVLPMIISVLVVPAAYWAGRELFGRAAALAGALMAATNPFLAWYGTETRMYTLVVLMAVLAITFTVRAVRSLRLRDAIGTAVCFALLLYTHDWALYLTAVTGLVVLIRAWQTRDRRLALGAVGVGVGVLVLYSPWLPTFIFQAQTTAAPWAVPPGIGDLFADPANTLAGTLDVIVVPVMALAVWHTHRDRSRADRTTATMVGMIGLGTLLVGWVASYIEPSWTIRYLAVALAPLLLAIAGSLASTFRGRVTLVALCAVLAAGTAVGALLPNANARYAKSNVAAIAAAAAPQLHPGDLVITTQTETLAVLYYYLPKGLHYATPTGPTDQPYVVDWRNIVSRLQRANPCQDLLPSLAALPVGADVLEINPRRDIGASGSAWNLAANAQVKEDDAFLAHQPGLARVASYAEGLNPEPYSAVEGELFTRTAGALTCQ
jgi:mannosyltransferase